MARCPPALCGAGQTRPTVPAYAYCMLQNHRYRPLHLPCPICDSAETIRTSERLGESFYLCRDCEHIWMVTVTATPGYATKRAHAYTRLPPLPLSELPAMKALLEQTRQRTDGRPWLKSSHSMVERQTVRAAARLAPSAQAKKRRVR